MKRAVLFVLSLFVLLNVTLAHETQTVGSGEETYTIIVGFATEPPFTDERNGLDLFVRTADDAPVENLENSLEAELTAPNGETRILTLRARYGAPGDYTDDFVLTMPGVYTVRVYGFIGELEVDAAFETHEVRPLSDLRFPNDE